MKLVSFFILLYLATTVEGFDGCDDPLEYRCGSVCIWGKSVCHCGNKTITFTENWHEYCCTNEECEKMYDKTEICRFDGLCSKGSAISINSSCNGNCFLSENFTKSEMETRIQRTNHTSVRKSKDNSLIPFGYTLPTSYVLPAGLNFTADFTLPTDITLTFDFILPAGFSVFKEMVFSSKLTLPKGSKIPFDYKTPFGFTIESGTELPYEVTIPPPIIFPAGTVLDSPLTLPSGFTLPAGLTLPSGFVLPTDVTLPKGFKLPIGDYFPMNVIQSLLDFWVTDQQNKCKIGNSSNIFPFQRLIFQLKISAFDFPLPSRHHTACASSEKCVPTAGLCRGSEPLCPDGSDLLLCSQNKKSCLNEKFTSLVEALRSCPYVKHPIGECYDTAKTNDGQYNCIERADELNSLIESGSFSENFTQCTSGFGIKCINQMLFKNCASPDYWCQDSIVGLPCMNYNNHSTNNPKTCSEVSRWRDQSCSVKIKLKEGETSTFNGLRCKGENSGQCIYPIYLNPDFFLDTGRLYQILEKTFNLLSNLKPEIMTCKDKSDQVHEQNTICDNKCFIEKTAQKINFTNLNKRIFEFCGANFDSKFCLSCRDPHNCQNSCKNPGLNCEACTNTDYFSCHLSGKCIHPSLRCDGHPQCDPPEDEDFEDCKLEYHKRSGGTLKCESPDYPGLFIVATPCDGIRECAGGEDESWLCTNLTAPIKYGVAASVFIMFMFIALKLYRKNRETENNQETTDSEEDNVDWNELKNSEVVNDELRSKLNINLLKIMFHFHEKNEEDKKQKFKEFYEASFNLNCQNLAQTHWWLKQNVDHTICNAMFNDVFPGLMKRLIPNSIKEINKKMENKEIFIWLMFLVNKTRKIFVIYVDLFKDTYLVVVMIIMTGSIFLFPTTFMSTVNNFEYNELNYQYFVTDYFLPDSLDCGTGGK